MPKYFFLGADRGRKQYSSQPQTCFLCGGLQHLCTNCVSELCSKCGTVGHQTIDFRCPVTCNLCTEPGHEYRMCLEVQLNLDHPEYYACELLRVEEERIRQERELQHWAETHGVARAG